jgi:hypothetical protein
VEIFNLKVISPVVQLSPLLYSFHIPPFYKTFCKTVMKQTQNWFSIIFCEATGLIAIKLDMNECQLEVEFVFLMLIGNLNGSQYQ